MESILENSPNPSRALVFGLLVSCLTTTNAESCSNCPLKELRGTLTTEEKHEYINELSDTEIKSILTQHESCYEKRLYDLGLW